MHTFKKDSKSLMNCVMYNNIITEYQKITDLLDSEVALNASNQPSKFRTRNWVEISDDIRGANYI